MNNRNPQFDGPTDLRPYFFAGHWYSEKEVKAIRRNHKNSAEPPHITFHPPAAAERDEWLEAVNRALYRYDNEPGFGVRSVAAALATAATNDHICFTGCRCGGQGVAEAPATNESKPEVVVLCGSTTFYDEFQQANYDLTMQGKIVLSVGFYPHAEHGHGEGVGHDSVEKVALDELHKRKIDLADRVYVLNVDGYIGESTRGEIDYAVSIGRPIDYLEVLR